MVLALAGVALVILARAQDWFPLLLAAFLLIGAGRRPTCSRGSRPPTSPPTRPAVATCRWWCGPPRSAPSSARTSWARARRWAASSGCPP
nr:hypothetical protein [Tessaracoccus coleopterorum]